MKPKTPWANPRAPDRTTDSAPQTTADRTTDSAADMISTDASGPTAKAGAHPAVAVRDLWFRYDGSTAAVLQGLTTSVTPRAVTAILGPNGVGKTTLLNLLLGWLRPTHGEVHIFGRPLGQLSRREMGQSLSLLPQEEHIPFEYSVEEYVLLGRTPYLSPLAAPSTADREIARTSLARVGLEEHIHTPVTEISGGERQLVMLARSLTQQPQILLMDEPTSHLDLSNKRRLANLVRSLTTDGTTVIFTTHDPEFAAVCADKLLLVRDGTLLAHGSIRDTMTAPLLSRLFGLSLSVTLVGGSPVVRW
ncbi:MAG: ABC transporter ATP-binding protein [Alkalispirochaeta sp.]